MEKEKLVSKILKEFEEYYREEYGEILVSYSIEDFLKFKFCKHSADRVIFRGNNKTLICSKCGKELENKT